MPVFEYNCLECDNKYEVLVKTSKAEDDVVCPKCNSKNRKKLFSSFSAQGFSQSYSAHGCSDGSCAMNNAGTCASGMCGLN
ncbi:MAG: zinc ribbon domain-containing protein [Ignavibacteria bacterium]|nr:zinc ribbon domain-containing protein [Ignavibacteria bacterium]